MQNIISNEIFKRDSIQTYLNKRAQDVQQPSYERINKLIEEGEKFTSVKDLQEAFLAAWSDWWLIWYVNYLQQKFGENYRVPTSIPDFQKVNRRWYKRFLDPQHRVSSSERKGHIVYLLDSHQELREHYVQEGKLYLVMPNLYEHVATRLAGHPVPYFKSAKLYSFD